MSKELRPRKSRVEARVTLDVLPLEEDDVLDERILAARVSMVIRHFAGSAR
jgi:hypothetical protein